MKLSLAPFSIACLVLALALAIGCGLLARGRARRIDRSSVPLLRDLVRELRALPVDERPAELSRRAQEGTWEHRLAQEVLSAPPGAPRVAAANDVLFDLDHELDVGKTWATAAIRIALAGTGALGIAGYIVTGQALALGGALLIGFCAAGVCYFSRERGEERASARREAFDALSSALLPEEAAAARSAQRARRRDRT